MHFKKIRNHIPTKSNPNSFHTKALVSLLLSSLQQQQNLLLNINRCWRSLSCCTNCAFYNSTVYAMSVLLRSDNFNASRELSPYISAQHFFLLGRICRSHGGKSVVGQITFPSTKLFRVHLTTQPFPLHCDKIPFTLKMVPLPQSMKSSGLNPNANRN